MLKAVGGSGRPLYLYFYMRAAADASGLVYGSTEKIGQLAGFKRRSAETALKKLQEYKFVVKVQRGVWFVNQSYADKVFRGEEKLGG